MKIIQFGENVEGYTIRVLNEREIRAAAGILFLFTFISLMMILFKGNFLMTLYRLFFFLYSTGKEKVVTHATKARSHKEIAK